MSVSPYDTHLSAASSIGHGTQPPRSRHGTGQRDRSSVVMRKFFVSSLGTDGDIKVSEQIGPAVPMFEAAFSAFAHGTLINTTQGLVAVEDLEPGTRIITAERGAQPLLWVGSMKLVPNAVHKTAHDARMTRIMADAFGVGRPMPDLLTGPGARLLTRPPDMRGANGNDRMMVPSRDLSDGISVIDIIPPSPVAVYHLALQHHSTIWANGLEMESFHPGQGFQQTMGQNMLTLFLSMFPHIREPEDFGGLSQMRRPLVSPEGLELA